MTSIAVHGWPDHSKFLGSGSACCCQTFSAGHCKMLLIIICPKNWEAGETPQTVHLNKNKFPSGNSSYTTGHGAYNVALGNL